MNSTQARIAAGQTYVGIEFGSTRIKAVLIDDTHAPIATGAYEWKSRLENGVWTYPLEEALTGMASAFAMMKAEVKRLYGVELVKIGGLGISGMMHGYLPFDGEGKQLTAFRTWQNTITEQAATALTERFGFNIPQRWSIAHLYQAMLNGEAHVGQIASITTLAGYIHGRLTGRKQVGVGEASGMFPIDSATCDYDENMLHSFDTLVAEKGYPWHLRDILPEVLPAGADAGCLTAEGALLLDATGTLEAGVPCCPPEGDAGTGMAATNSVAKRTGNVSAGTSVFAMVVMDKPLQKVHTEIDLVTTPSGAPVAMVHCNNCTGDINAWAGMLEGFGKAMGMPVDRNKLYTELFKAALRGAPDCGGVVNCNYFSGEPVTGLEDGRPLMMRLSDANLSFENFARSLVCSAIVSLKLGMDILAEEAVQIDSLLGHGGFFKTPEVGQKLLAAALNTPVSVMETAGEGGPWGMALLAAYRVRHEEGEALETYLANKVFAGVKGTSVSPDDADVAGFSAYVRRYVAALPVEQAAVNTLK